jgi:hypothetical protein
LKYFNGSGFYKGDVVGFDENTGLYKVEFEEGKIEYFAENALEKITTKALIQRGASLNRKYVSISEEEDSSEGELSKKKRKMSSPQASTKKMKNETPTKPKVFKQKYEDGTKVSKVSKMTYMF